MMTHFCLTSKLTERAALNLDKRSSPVWRNIVPAATKPLSFFICVLNKTFCEQFGSWLTIAAAVNGFKQLDSGPEKVCVYREKERVWDIRERGVGGVLMSLCVCVCMCGYKINYIQQIYCTLPMNNFAESAFICHKQSNYRLHGTADVITHPAATRTHLLCFWRSGREQYHCREHISFAAKLSQQMHPSRYT